MNVTGEFGKSELSPQANEENEASKFKGFNSPGGSYCFKAISRNRSVIA